MIFLVGLIDYCTNIVRFHYFIAMTATHVCDPTFFRCNNGRCIQPQYRCDYDDDCKDGSDEMDCGTSKTKKLLIQDYIFLHLKGILATFHICVEKDILAVF